MSPSRLILLLALVLVGCAGDRSADLAKLEAQVITLSHELQAQAGTRKAELDLLQRQASVAAGCDFLLPLCPDSVAAAGRAAQEDGIAATGLWFWVAFGLKLLAVGGAVGALLASLVYGWYRAAMPARAQVDAALAAIAEADGRVTSALERSHEAERRERDARERSAAIQSKMAQAELDLAEAERAVEAAHLERARVEAVRDALSAF
jgi:hypothetical protein